MNAEIWTLTLARLKYWGWWLLTKLCLGVVCLGIIAEGLRFFVPSLGQKLYRMPALGFLKHYEETRQLDIAPFLAVFFLIAVWSLLEQMLRFWLREEEAKKDLCWNPERQWMIVLTLGLILLTADATLFYTAMVGMSWGNSLFSLSALLATVAYIAVLVFTSYVSVNLGEHVYQLTKEESDEIKVPVVPVDDVDGDLRLHAGEHDGPGDGFPEGTELVHGDDPAGSERLVSVGND